MIDSIFNFKDILEYLHKELSFAEEGANLKFFNNIKMS